MASGEAARGRDAGQKLKRLVQPWQLDALGYYDRLGEIHYAAGFYARPLSKLRLYVAERDASGEYVESDDPVALGAWERVQDPSGGRAQMLRAYGILAFLPGESYLLWTGGDEDEPETWEIVSPDEVRMQGDVIARFRAPTLPPELLSDPPDDMYEPIKGEARLYRLWTPHPRWSALADSPMRGVLDLCAELVMLTRVVKARGRSRLAGAGMLKVPTEIAPLPQPQNAGGSGDSDPFLDDLMEAMVTPIEDEDAASAVVPMIVRGDAEALKALDLLLMRSADEVFPENALREQTIRRIALGLDMPPEVLLGMAESNHWTAWQVVREAWRHAEPVASRFCDDMTSVYLRPTLTQLGVSDPGRYAIRFDAAEILTNPDRGEDANEAFDRFTIGPSAHREAHGFSDDDAPTPAELEVMRENAGVASSADDGPVAVADAASPVGADTPERAPDEPQLVARLTGVAEAAVERAREVAGARLRGMVQGHRQHAAAILDVPNATVASSLGYDVMQNVGAQPLQLVRGSGALFTSAAARVGMDAAAARTVADLIEQHAARTLLDDEPPPIPAGIVSLLREAA